MCVGALVVGRHARAKSIGQALVEVTIRPEKVGRYADSYSGEDSLLRRQDYQLDVAGAFPVAQYVGDVIAVDGIQFPTKRRAYMRAPDLKPIRDLLMVAIDFNNFKLTS